MIIGDFEDPEIVKRSVDSVKDYVDGMYFTVTYKEGEPQQNELVGLLNAYVAKHGGRVDFFKWTYNFSDARQFALDQVPKGPEIFVYWQDADDVLMGGENLHKIADEMPGLLESAVYFDYWYQVELNPDGSVKEILVKHKRERIIRNDDTWKWVGNLHETLIEQKQENLIRHFRKECYVMHLTDNQRLDHNITRNVEILEQTAAKENHKDPRTLIYLAKAYFDQAKMAEKPEDRKIKLDLALNLFHEYLAGVGTPGKAGYQEPSGWPEERSTAWAYIAEIAVLTGHPEVAIGGYQNAIDEAPYFPEYYIDLAMCYVMMENFKKGEHWLNVATSMPEPDTTIIQFPRERKTRALEASFHINMHKNKLDLAVQDAQMLVDIIPNDPLAQQRLQHVSSLKAYNQACQSVVYLSKYLEQIKEQDKIKNLIEAMPSDMHNEQFAAQMKHLFMPARIWEKDEIAIICGPGFEKWDGNSVQTGLGGSEEAVVYLSQELVKQGWRVTVYASPEKHTTIKGVQYKVWHDLNPKDQFNVLILWRGIGFLDVKPVARFKMLWLHDVPNNPDFTEDRVEQLDKIAVLSEYHKSLLRLHKNGMFFPMPDEKVFVTSNGIPPLTNEWKGKSHSLIYASSYDRGLIYLLQNWKKVREAVPDAELNIYYGWDLYDKVHQGNPAREQWKNDVLNMMKQDGIVSHGRVGHKALHAAFAKASVWAYPTDFQEISCITAMKAQALGAIPCVTDYAALQETVKNGIKVDVDITTDEGQEEYITALTNLLKDEAKQEDIRKTMVPWARKYFAWDNVAKLWGEEFKTGIKNNESKPTITATATTTDSGQPSEAEGSTIPALPGRESGGQQGPSTPDTTESNGSDSIPRQNDE